MKNYDKKRLFRDSERKRKEFIHQLQNELYSYSEVDFAYLFGSFLEALPYHDIDIGIYFSRSSENKMHDLAINLASILSKKVERPVDVRVLNSAPTGFLYHVFRGHLLMDQDEDLRVRLMERVIMRYLDMKPLMEKSLKEAMTR
jgi:predicted nucleotidyltransferase